MIKIVFFTFLFISSAFAVDGSEVEKSETIMGKDKSKSVKINESANRVGVYDDRKTKGQFLFF